MKGTISKKAKLLKKISVLNHGIQRVDLVIVDESGIMWGLQARPRLYHKVAMVNNNETKQFEFRNEFSEQYSERTNRTYHHNNLILENIS